MLRNILLYPPKSNDQKKKRKKKALFVRGLARYTESTLATDSLKYYGFTVTSATMLKNRKTRNTMPIYMVNILSRPNFAEIYTIKHL